MRRMNEMWTRMTLVLFLSLLLILSCQGQDATPEASTASQPADGATTQAVNANTLATDASTSYDPPTDSAVPEATQNVQDVKVVVSTVVAEPQSSYTSIHLNVENPKIQTNMDATQFPDDQQVDVALEDQSGKTTPTVLISLLLIGLAVAAALIGGYVWKNHCCSNAKGMKLADESCMLDEENQGNTLVSVSPLNPPEAQEKPSQNGESPEAAKTQQTPAATNGHSTTKTADTEL